MAIASQDTIEVDTYNPVAFSAGVGSFGQASYQVRQLNDTVWEVQMSDSAGNNEPLGATNISMAFDTFMTRLTPPVQSRITFTSQGVQLPYTDMAGHQATGQLDSETGFIQDCASGSTIISTTVSKTNIGNYNFSPAPRTCSNLSGLTINADLNGFIGAFQASANIRVEMDNSDATQLASGGSTKALLRLKPAQPVASGDFMRARPVLNFR